MKNALIEQYKELIEGSVHEDTRANRHIFGYAAVSALEDMVGRIIAYVEEHPDAEKHMTAFATQLVPLSGDLAIWSGMRSPEEVAEAAVEAFSTLDETGAC